jgi:bifunctional oligoribonuclease and PAP phosphatase NrnA
MVPGRSTFAVPADVIASFAGRHGRALLLGHVNPDADVLGTLMALGLALESKGWSFVAGGPHPVPDVLAFLPAVTGYRRLDAIEGRFDVTVMTDCPNPGRTEGLIEQARPVSATIVNIDHHPDNRRYGDVNWVEPAAAATGELVYSLLRELGAPITPDIAMHLYTAIHTDTGSFRYSNVTPRTFRIAAELVESGADPAFVAGALYERRAPDSLRWLGDVLGRIRVSEDGRVAWLGLPAGVVPESFIEAEDLVNYPRSIESVRVACLLRERDGKVKVSLRGKGDVDVSRVAACFGGGGHPNAAGCTIAGSLDRVTETVLATVRGAVEARDPR